MSTADALTCLAFSPDGQKIASGTARSGVTVTNLSSKSEHQLEMLADTQSHVTVVAWSPDGEKIISALPDHTIHCWNVTSTHTVGPAFAGHKDVILTAGFLPDSSHAISLSRDGELLVWDTESGRVTQAVTVSNAAQTIFVAALSIDSSLLVTSGTKEGVAWEIPKSVRVADITLPDVPLLHAAIIPQSRPRVVLAFGDRSFWVWDTSTGKHDDERFEGLDQDDIPFAMAASPDGKLLALEIDGDVDHPTHFYDLKGHEFTTSNMRCTHPFAFSPDGKFFAASSVPSDSKDSSRKLVVRSVEEIIGCSRTDLPTTITPRTKGEQRSVKLNPRFFDQSPLPSGSAKGSPIRRGPRPLSSSAYQQASPGTTGRERRILPFAKIWKKRDRHPRSPTNARKAQQASSRSTSREGPLDNIWKRIRHPQSHRTTSTPLVEVGTAQAKRRTVISGPRRSATARSSSDARGSSHSRSASTQEGSAQAVGDTRHNCPGATTSRLRYETTAGSGSAQTSERPGYIENHINIEDRESVDSGIVYTERDIENVRPHGCWNIFWNWLCYKAF